jgi:hypothetical protein
MASVLLQGEHDGRQFRSGYFLTMALVADVKVLAKQTHEIAVGKKYGAGAVGAHQRLCRKAGQRDTFAGKDCKDLEACRRLLFFLATALFYKF